MSPADATATLARRPAAAAGLLDKPLVVVTGKGGVGKSTVAAALGPPAPRRGRPTIIAQVPRRGRLPRLLRGPRAHEGGRAPRLPHTPIEPEEAMQEHL